MSDLQIASVLPESERKPESGSMQGKLLVLVLDINPSQPFFAQSPGGLLQCIDSVLTLTNSHLMLHPNNALAAIAAHGQSCSFLYPDSNPEDQNQLAQGPSDGQFEGFYKVETTIRNKVKEILTRETEPKSPVYSDSLISGALCMALAYINRKVTDPASDIKSARILVLSASGDTTTQYMNYMNVFFSAQKMDVNIDTCMIDQDSGLLQQGADITGGCYHKVDPKQLKCLLQFLLWLYLPGPSLRSGLSLPTAQRVDYRAACFCHRDLIEIGYVCSVCLSIFCKFGPICTTCHTVFKTPGPLIPVMKKKKM